MKNILVTGGAGYIGSITILVLLQKGYKVTSIDSHINSSSLSYKRIRRILKNYSKDCLKNFDYYEGDIRDYNFLKNIFIKNIINKESFDGVIHFAGLKAVRDSINNPIEYWSSNVEGTINLIKVMKKFNCKKIIFSSSASIYEPVDNRLLRENSKIKPINTYANTKNAIEIFLNDLYKSSPNEWSIINFRYFNPIGAHNSGLIGESPVGMPNNIFPLINKVALGQLEKINIFGNDWDTPDGTCVRDYIHVMDLAKGHILGIEYLFDNQPQIKTLNLGTGNGHSVLDLIKKFEEYNKVKIPYVFTDRRLGDLSSSIADNSLTKKILKWEPKKDLKSMCIDGWKWYKNNENIFF